MSKELSKQNVIVSKNEIIKQALSSTKIRECTQKDLAYVVSDEVDKIIFYLGLNKDDIDSSMLKTMIMNDIREHFPSLTLKEIEIALQSGVRGEYGNVIGFAPKDAYIWIYAFSRSQERKEIVSKIEKEQPVNKPTEDEIKKLAWENTLRAWESYKENDYFNDYGNIIYKYLVKNGKINYSEDQRNDFKRMAKVALNSQYNPSNSVGNAIKMNEHRHILKEVNSSDDNARLISEAKKLALNHFFKELKEIGSEIQDLFIEE